MLIADEVTSMVDQEGRDALLSVLSGLTKRHRTALVHITHFNNEAGIRRPHDQPQRIHRTTPIWSRRRTDPTPTVGVNHRRNAPALELIGVGHEYGSGTPWAKTALRDISFVVEQGRRGADPRRQRLG